MEGYIFVFVVVSLFGLAFILRALFYRAIKRTKKQLPKTHPDVWNHFAIHEITRPMQLPDILLKRIMVDIKSDLLPTKPVMFIKPDIELEVVVGLSIIKTALRELESTCVDVIILKSMQIMSETLGLSGTTYSKQITKMLSRRYQLAKKDGAYIYACNVQGGTYIPKNEKEAGVIKVLQGQLPLICSQLGIDFNDMGLDGNYDPGKNTYIGWGGAGAIGLGIAASVASSLKRAYDMAIYNRASAYIAYNNIVHYFNSVYN